MSFAAEMRDFVAAFQAGYKIIGSRDDREYKKLRNQWMQQKINEYPDDRASMRELRSQRVRAADDAHTEHEWRMQHANDPTPGAYTPSAADVGTGSGIVPTPKVPTPSPSTTTDGEDDGDGGGPQSALDLGTTTMSARATSTNGKPVPSDLLSSAEGLLRNGGSPGQLKRFMAQQGYPMHDNWCGDFAASMVSSTGGTPPDNPQVASNWRNYGQATTSPAPGDVMVRTTDRNTGRALQIGQLGGHVGFFKGYDDSGRPIIVGGNGGIHPVDPRDYEFRHADPNSPSGIDFGMALAGAYARGGMVQRFADGGVVNPHYNGPGGLNFGVDGVPSGSEGVDPSADDSKQEDSPGRQFSMLSVRDALATGVGALKRLFGADAAQQPTQKPQALPVDSGDEPAASDAGNDSGGVSALDLSARTKSLSAPAALRPSPAPRTKFQATQTAAGGAMPTPEEFAKLKDMADPEHKLSEGERTAKAYAAVHEFYMHRGEPEKAGRVLGQMLLYNRQEFQRWNSLAAVAAQDGNTDAAAKAVVKAYGNVPDGNSVQLRKNADGSYTWSQMDDENGGILKQGRLQSPDDLAKTALGWGGSGMFDQLVMEAVNGKQPAAAEKPAKLSDRAKSQEMIEGDQTKVAFPKGMEGVGTSIAQSLLPHNDLDAAGAKQAASALLDPASNPRMTSTEDGGAVMEMPGDKRPIKIPRNTYLRLLAIRADQLKNKSEADAKQKQDGEARNARDNAVMAVQQPMIDDPIPPGAPPRRANPPYFQTPDVTKSKPFALPWSR